ncbi:MAG: hypothetical protein GYA24_12505 [Candidatus Lokiarchaeota archaeon]|nr:hypothetical protein [Candidatus Lokiarchaeota archaeon]
MKYFDHHVHTGHSRCVKQPYTLDAALDLSLSRGFIEGFGSTNHVHFNSPDQSHLAITREQVDAINARRGKSFILLGAEVDIDHPSGRFTITKKTLDLLDYIIAGPHNQPHRSLAMDGMGKEEFDEYFEALEAIIINSLSRNPVDVWVHPFLQEIEIGGEFFQEYLLDILDDILPVLKEKGIAMEISATFPRDKGNQVEIFKPGLRIDGWLQVMHMITRIYKAALDFGGIKFSFASDAHALENVGDIGAPIAIARWLGIPGNCILHLADLQGRNP